MARCLMELADFHRKTKTICACGHKAIVNVPIAPQGNSAASGVQIRFRGNSYLAMRCNAGRRKNDWQPAISSREK